ncbi:MAG: Nif11-like leader peptide family RiPP precursor [Coriobacteriia bacterium]|nr:Nif11-like leader peptide family RiPP precursor [Coriobacteriia bacterium]
MSKEDALRFLEQARTDRELVEKVRAAIVDGNAASFASAASNLGFAFTEEELAEASAELRQADIDKLDGMEVDDEGNLRDGYFREIMVGEQDEVLYDSSKRFKIIGALKRAGANHAV